MEKCYETIEVEDKNKAKTTERIKQEEKWDITLG